MVEFDYKHRLSIVIRSARIELGLTQEEMAYRTSINPTYYSKIERGENNAGVDKLAAIAKELDISLSQLFILAENLQQNEHHQNSNKTI